MGEKYQENEDFVPNPTDQTGTVNTIDSRSPHARSENITADQGIKGATIHPVEDDEAGEPAETVRVGPGEGQETVVEGNAAVVPPQGVEDDNQGEPDAEPDEDRPGGNASTEEWHTYRLGHGYTRDELEGKGRDELRDLEDR